MTGSIAKLVCHGLLCLALLISPLHALAATIPLPGFKTKKNEPQTSSRPATAISDESIDESLAKLEARLTELRLQLSPAAVTAIHKTYRDVASPQELAEREQLTTRLAGILEDHVNGLISLRSLRKSARDRTVDFKGWQGFTEKPPYPLSLLDSLRDSIAAQRTRLQSLEVMRTTAEDELEEFSGNLKSSRKQLRLAEEAMEKSSGTPDEPRKRWLLLLAKLREQLNQAGTVYAEVRQVFFQESLAATQTEIDFIERKLAVARGNYRFTKENLQQKLESIDNRRQQLSRELEQAIHDADLARKQLEASEASLRKAEAGIRRPGGMLTLGPVFKTHEMRQVLFDAASFRVQVIKAIIQLLRNETALWKDRYRIASGAAAAADPENAEISQKDLEYVSTWKGFLAARVSTLHSLIRSQQEKLANATLAAYEREAINRMLAVYRDQEALLRRGEEYLNEFERLVLRRNEEAQSAVVKVSLKERARDALGAVSSLAMKIWNTELYVAEETIIAEGKTIVRPRSVTIGKLLQAFLILLAGTLVLRRLKRPIHWFAVNRLRFDESNALLYTRLLTYLMFIGLLVCSLIFVNIPLAIFAFFGGALAIGIGFGAQNLINNFISGLILMFDRTIRLGDVVELDIHRGRVTAIGMRNSRVKRFDGVEMLVPNSQFLQQNVINWTLSDRRVRYTVTVGVAYGSSTRETAQLILKAVEAQAEVLTDPPAYVTFDNFAESSLSFSAYFWLEMDPAMNSLEICSDIRHRIGEMLGEAGISIPFPQRDLHVSTIKPLEIIMSGPDSSS